jgi:hypothetical protein
MAATERESTLALVSPRSKYRHQPMTGPAECPKCGFKSLEMQVTAWWHFVHGQPTGQGDDYLEAAPRAYAICDHCSEQWLVPPNHI